MHLYVHIGDIYAPICTLLHICTYRYIYVPIGDIYAPIYIYAPIGGIYAPIYIYAPICIIMFCPFSYMYLYAYVPIGRNIYVTYM